MNNYSCSWSDKEVNSTCQSYWTYSVKAHAPMINLGYLTSILGLQSVHSQKYLHMSVKYNKQSLKEWDLTWVSYGLVVFISKLKEKTSQM